MCVAVLSLKTRGILAKVITGLTLEGSSSKNVCFDFTTSLHAVHVDDSYGTRASGLLPDSDQGGELNRSCAYKTV